MDGSSGPAENGVEVDPELTQIGLLCAGPVRRMNEGGRSYIFMEGLRFFVRGAQKQMDALLCLNHPNNSYPTKLFLPENLGVGLNWNETAFIFARHWFSWSWKDVSPNQEPVAILGEHLRAFQ